jgi:TetR/AcrR family transcriptional repressor of lmrAB and yxaGH operons
VAAAATLFRRGGYAASGVADIVAASGAPKGSLYHHFPDGKDAIGAAAVTFAAARVTATLEQLAARHTDAGGLLRAYAALLAGWMAKSGFRDGCPITTTVLETVPASQLITAAAATGFVQWQAVFVRALRRDGVAPVRAERLARFAIAALEGALILARVEQSPRAITEAAHEAAALFDAARKKPRS